MANDYIRKEDMLKGQKTGTFANGVALEAMRCVPVGYIESIKPADVVPVVHGKWMKEDRGHVEYCAICDQCGFDWMWSDRGYFKFCPNCGAKMDGGES